MLGCATPPVVEEELRINVGLPGLALEMEVPEDTEVTVIGGRVHVTQRPRTRNPRWMTIARAGAEDRGALDQRDGKLQYRVESSDAGLGGIAMDLLGSITIDRRDYDVTCGEEGEEAPNLGWCLAALRTLRAGDEAEALPASRVAKGKQPSSPATPTSPAPSAEQMLAALTGDELLVVRAPREPLWRGFRRSPDRPEYVQCELIGTTNYEHLDLIYGEVRMGKREDEWPFPDNCEVVRVDHKFSRTEHPIRPLSAHHLGDMVLGLSPKDQPWLAGADLEKGQLRGFVGGVSGLVVFANAYLQDLGTHLAIPDRPLLTRVELEADLATRQAAGKRVGRLGGAKHFAPQVASSDERMVFAKVPVLSVTAASNNYQDEGPTAVPLRVGEETRYLMFQQHMMTASWEAAFRRGRVIERIVEDGARPGE